MEHKNNRLFAASEDQIYIFDTSGELNLINVIDHNLNRISKMSAVYFDDDPEDYCIYLAGSQSNTFIKPGFYENGDPVTTEGHGVEIVTSNYPPDITQFQRMKNKFQPYLSEVWIKGMAVKQNIIFVTGMDDFATTDDPAGYVRLIDFKDPTNPVVLDEYRSTGFFPIHIKEHKDHLFVYSFMTKFYIFKLPEIDYGFEPAITMETSE